MIMRKRHIEGVKMKICRPIHHKMVVKEKEQHPYCLSACIADGAIWRLFQ